MVTKESYKVINSTRGVDLAEQAEVADTFLTRLVGLLNRENLPAGEGLIIRPCNSVHTFFMRFPIDVLFLNADGKIVDMRCELMPHRATQIVPEAKSVLELPAGTVLATRTMPGDQLEFVDCAATFSE